MRRSLRAQPEAHVSIEDLVAHDEGAVKARRGSRADSRPDVVSHLARCPACRSDLEALERARRVRDDSAWGPRPAAPPESTRPATLRRSIAWTAAAAAILALAGAGLVTAPWHRPEGRSLATSRRSITFMPPKRSGVLERTLFAGERVSIRVVLPYEAATGSYQARIEREDGSIVGQPATTPIDAESLTVEIATPLEPGAYRLILTPEDRADAGEQAYPFRVLAAPGPRGG
jgi:hypothetical protein